MKKFYVFLVTCCIVLIGCSAAKKESVPKLKPLSFEFTPPAGTSGSNDITFGLIAPIYVESFEEKKDDPYKAFAKNMENDFVEMLTARGYSYKGPYENIDEMVYGDKKSSDLLIQPVIDLQFTGTPMQSSVSDKGVTSYYYDGNVSIAGTLNLSFAEPFTHTKVWVKSIKTDPISFNLKSYYAYDTQVIPNTDPLVWNTLSDNLSKIYSKILQTAWNHLEPEELMQKKSEADEIKKNSGFIKD